MSSTALSGPSTGARTVRRIHKRRHPWRWAAAVVACLVVALVVVAFARAQIKWPAVGRYITSHLFIDTVWRVLLLAVVAQGIAIVLGLVTAVMRLSGNPVASRLAWLYVWLFRGVPVLLQIILWYNLALVIKRVDITVLGWHVINESTNTLITPFVAAVLGLSLNEAAYMAEIVRGGMKSVDSGQVEAAAALGMSPARVTTRIVMPQAMRAIIPPTGNNFINMLKATALASTITYPELLYVSQSVSAVNLEVVETLFAAAFWYMVLVSAFSVGQYFLEKKFDAGFARSTPRTTRQIMRAGLRLRGRRALVPTIDASEGGPQQ
ncbi:amino acid ABC transporter permease [Streptomyces hokutonensis]|uniref:amino acid ABC transporter permease n=1 Tax=Streptomyces hokutonensis TaxID=1306990 RepID=UPI0037F94931